MGRNELVSSGTSIVSVVEGGNNVGAVECLAVSGPDLYVGGRFRNAGGAFATNIARWDGTNWRPLGNGLRYFNGPGSENGAVRALAAFGSEIYAGGEFRLAGNQNAINIAKWNGSDWQANLPGVNDELPVLALAMNGCDLFAGGSFDQIGGIFAKRVAKWDGFNWTSLGGGIGEGFGDGIRVLISNGSELLAGGLFSSAGNGPSTNIGLWHIPHGLEILRGSGQTVLCWPATGSNFVLDASVEMPGTNWTEVPQAPLAIGSALVVTNAMSDLAHFFRLRRR